jgi:hypothetical protein
MAAGEEIKLIFHPVAIKFELFHGSLRMFKWLSNCFGQSELAMSDLGARMAEGRRVKEERRRTLTFQFQKGDLVRHKVPNGSVGMVVGIDVNGNGVGWPAPDIYYEVRFGKGGRTFAEYEIEKYTP